jgi:hypothetical protein
MTAQKFKETLQNDLNGFIDMWEKGHKENPNMYPEELEEGDWLDQFLIHLTTND